MTEVSTVEEDRKKGIWSKMGWISKLLIIAIIGSTWYLISLTGEVPNTTYTNYTNPITNTTISTPHVRYQANDTAVPAEAVDPAFAMFQTIMVLILVYLLVKVEQKQEEYITIDEAIAIVEKEIKRWQIEERLPRGIAQVKPTNKLTHFAVAGDRKPFKYVLDVEIQRFDNNLEIFYFAEVNAKTKYLLGFIPTTAPLSRVDTCGRCGQYSDLKVITADQFREFRMIRQQLGGRT